MATKQIAQGLAALGRNGDSVLVHMQPHEVAGLNAIAKAQGTELTKNPYTGMPEAFSLGGFFSSLLPTLIGGGVGMIPGAPLWAGIAAGAATGALTNKKDPLMGAVMGGMGGYGGFGLGQGLATAGAAPASAGVNLANVPGAAAAAPAATSGPGINLTTTQLDKALASTGTNFDPLVREAALRNVESTLPGVQFNPTMAKEFSGAALNPAGEFGAGAIKQSMVGAQPTTATAGGAYTPQQGLSRAGDNLGKLVSGDKDTWQSFKTAIGANSDLAAAGKIGMPLGGAVLGGLEPSDIYGKPLKPSNVDKYDPYATLNLAGDTGLRLYAAGGPVSFADGGDAMKGGGAGAMEGAGMMPVDVSDINAKYGIGEQDNTASNGMNLAMPMLGRQAPINVPVPTVGAFADADIINGARDAYEKQVLEAMQQRSQGMFGLARALDPRASYAQQINAQRTGVDNSGNPIVRMALPNTARTASTAETAKTAPTASTLNLNATYAEGGSITSGGIRDLYGTSDDQANGAVLSQDGYGLGRLNAMYGGGMTGMAKGGYLDGPGDGMSDSIPASIEGKQPARLADGEFVVPADVVSHLGNGSSKAGAKVLYSMLDKVRSARTGDKKQGKQINPNKFLPA